MISGSAKVNSVAASRTEGVGASDWLGGGAVSTVRPTVYNRWNAAAVLDQSGETAARAPRVKPATAGRRTVGCVGIHRRRASPPSPLCNVSAAPTQHDASVTSVSLDQGATRHLRTVLKGDLDLDLTQACKPPSDQ